MTAPATGHAPSNQFDAALTASTIKEARERLATLLVGADDLTLSRAITFARFAAERREYEAVAQILCLALNQLRSPPPAGMLDEAADRLFEALEATQLSPADAAAWVGQAFDRLKDINSQTSLAFVAEEVENRASAPLRTVQLLALMKNSFSGPPKPVLRQIWAPVLIPALYASGMFALLVSGAPLPTPEGFGAVVDIELWRFMLWLWAPLLIITWAVMWLNAARIGATRFLPPSALFTSQRIVTGHHQGFNKDAFFHIFAFIWIPIIAVVAGAEAVMPDFLEHFDAAPGRFGAGWALDIFNLSNESAGVYAIYAIAAAVALFSLFNQAVRLQGGRLRRSVDFFWWDIRLGRPIWHVRLVMVGLSMFFGITCFLELVICVFVFAAGAMAPGLEVDLLNIDATAGLLPIRNALDVSSWAVIMFGVFVMSGLYLHQGLPEYRSTDLFLIGLFATTVILGVVLPFYELNQKVGSAVEALRSASPMALGELGLADPSNFLRQMILRDFDGMIIGLDRLNSPALPLAGQIVWVVARLIASTRMRKQAQFSRWTSQ